jgi:hypothetical protein
MVIHEQVCQQQGKLDAEVRRSAQSDEITCWKAFHGIVLYRVQPVRFVTPFRASIILKNFRRNLKSSGIDMINANRASDRHRGTKSLRE